MMRLASGSDAALVLLRCDVCGCSYRICVDTYVDGALVHFFPLSRGQLSQLLALFPGIWKECRGCGAAIDQTAWREWAGVADEVAE